MSNCMLFEDPTEAKSKSESNEAPPGFASFPLCSLQTICRPEEPARNCRLALNYSSTNSNQQTHQILPSNCDSASRAQCNTDNELSTNLFTGSPCAPLEDVNVSTDSDDPSSSDVASERGIMAAKEEVDVAGGFVDGVASHEVPNHNSRISFMGKKRKLENMKQEKQLLRETRSIRPIALVQNQGTQENISSELVTEDAEKSLLQNPIPIREKVNTYSESTQQKSPARSRKAPFIRHEIDSSEIPSVSLSRQPLEEENSKELSRQQGKSEIIRRSSPRKRSLSYMSDASQPQYFEEDSRRKPEEQGSGKIEAEGRERKSLRKRKMTTFYFEESLVMPSSRPSKFFQPPSISSSNVMWDQMLQQVQKVEDPICDKAASPLTSRNKRKSAGKMSSLPKSIVSVHRNMKGKENRVKKVKESANSELIMKVSDAENITGASAVEESDNLGVKQVLSASDVCELAKESNRLHDPRTDAFSCLKPAEFNVISEVATTALRDEPALFCCSVEPVDHTEIGKVLRSEAGKEESSTECQSEAAAMEEISAITREFVSGQNEQIQEVAHIRNQQKGDVTVFASMLSISVTSASETVACELSCANESFIKFDSLESVDVAGIVSPVDSTLDNSVSALENQPGVCNDECDMAELNAIPQFSDTRDECMPVEEPISKQPAPLEDELPVSRFANKASPDDETIVVFSITNDIPGCLGPNASQSAEKDVASVVPDSSMASRPISPRNGHLVLDLKRNGLADGTSLRVDEAANECSVKNDATDVPPDCTSSASRDLTISNSVESGSSFSSNSKTGGEEWDDLNASVAMDDARTAKAEISSCQTSSEYNSPCRQRAYPEASRRVTRASTGKATDLDMSGALVEQRPQRSTSATERKLTYSIHTRHDAASLVGIPKKSNVVSVVGRAIRKSSRLADRGAPLESRSVVTKRKQLTDRKNPVQSQSSCLSHAVPEETGANRKSRRLADRSASTRHAILDEARVCRESSQMTQPESQRIRKLFNKTRLSRVSVGKNPPESRSLIMKRRKNAVATRKSLRVESCRDITEGGLPPTSSLLEKGKGSSRSCSLVDLSMGHEENVASIPVDNSSSLRPPDARFHSKNLVYHGGWRVVGDPFPSKNASTGGYLVSFSVLLDRYDRNVSRGKCERVDFGLTLDTAKIAIDEKVKELRKRGEDGKTCESEVVMDMNDHRRNLKLFCSFEDQERLERAREKEADKTAERLRLYYGRNYKKTREDLETENVLKGTIRFESHRTLRRNEISSCPITCRICHNVEEKQSSHAEPTHALMPLYRKFDIDAADELEDDDDEGKDDKTTRIRSKRASYICKKGSQSLMELTELKHTIEFIEKYYADSRNIWGIDVS